MNEVEKAEHAALFALFVEHHSQPNRYIDLGELYVDYHLTFPKEWLASSLSEWEDAGWVDIAQSHDATSAILRDDRYNAVLKHLLGWLGASQLTVRAKHEEIYSDQSPPKDIPMREGWKWFTYAGDGGSTDAKSIIPASDRVVSLNHNSPDYVEITEMLGDVAEAVRGHNGEGVEPSTRDRIIASLEAASTLWAAAELRIIQIKVGVLMAAEDAVRALSTTTKAVAAALLVDIIKAFVKNHFGVDLDKI